MRKQKNDKEIEEIKRGRKKQARSGIRMRLTGDQSKTSSSNSRFRRFFRHVNGRTYGRTDPLIVMQGRI